MELLESFIRNLFEFMYYMKKKKKRGVIPAWIMILMVCVGIIAWLGYLIVGTLLGFGDSFSRVDAIVIAGCIIAIFFIMNIFDEKVNVEKTIIKHVYLNQKIRKSNWIDYFRLILVLILISVICTAFMPTFNQFCKMLELNETESTIVCFVAVLSITYLALVETISDEVRRYRIKTIACMLIFLILIIVYMQIYGDNKIEEKDVLGILVFGFGQLAFLDSGIGNYRALYKCLEEKYELDLELYYQEVVEKFDAKFSNVQSGISGLKTIAFFMSETWKKLDFKKKMIFVTLAAVLLILAIGITVLAENISKYSNFAVIKLRSNLENSITNMVRDDK